MAINNSNSVIAFFLKSINGGGAERAVIALAGHIAKRGYAVDLVVGDGEGDLRGEVSAEVNLVDFRIGSSLLVFCKLLAYLRNKKPTAVLAALEPSNIILVSAARLIAYKGRTIISQHSMLQNRLDECGVVKRIAVENLQFLLYPRADKVISVCRAAVDDLHLELRIPKKKIITIHNSVDVENIQRLADESLADDWYLQGEAPLILSVGSFRQLKDRTTLVKAFAIANARRPLRLVILGKGAEKHRIESLIAELKLADRSYLPGFEPNPYKWMQRAAVLVSSSTTEGCPVNILEALALNTPIVATDCPGDTAVLLEHGKWGRLVPIGDAARMAAAILESLDDPALPDGRIRAADFSPEKVTNAHLDVLLPR